MLYAKMRKQLWFVYECNGCCYEAHGPKLWAVCIAGKAHLKIKHKGKEGEMQVWEEDLLKADAEFAAHAKVCRTCNGDGPGCCEVGDRILILVNDAIDTGLQMEDREAKTSIATYYLQKGEKNGA